jgi:hypothetical protein
VNPNQNVGTHEKNKRHYFSQIRPCRWTGDCSKIAQIAVAVVYPQDFLGFPANAESATRVMDIGSKTQ